ncbi:MAG: nucleotide pyrophosphohydrolase [Candidatus Saccharimonadales bacterium]
MTTKELQQRALEIRKQFAIYERQQGSPEWDTREIMEGFVVDVGDLMKLVMAQQGLRKVEGLDEKIAHELADCLWCVLVLASKLGVDLEKAFTDTMNSLETSVATKLRKS